LGSGLGGAWINIEEFAEDRMKLLSLLHHRTTYQPCEWAAFDAREMTRYFNNPAIPLRFNASCILISETAYGRLVPFDVDLIHSGAALGFPRACAIAHVQLFIADGLHRIVKELIAGAEPSGNTKWVELVSGGLHSTAHVARWGAYDNQAFSPPSKFDPDVLLDMATDQLNRVVDAVELLQGDQDYFRKYAKEMKASISWDASVPASMKWSYVAGTIAALWSNRLFQWQELVYKSHLLGFMYRVHHTLNEDGAEISQQLRSTMIDYGTTLRYTIEWQLTHLDLAVHDMPATKEIHTKHEKNGFLSQRRKFSQDYSKQANLLEHTVSTLSNWMSFRDQKSGRGALNNMLAELSKVEADNRVDETVSTIAVLDSMRLIWLSGHVLPRDDLKSATARVEAARTRMNDMYALHGLIDMKTYRKRYQDLGSHLQNFCESPMPKNRNSPTWLEKRSDARRLLATFWRCAREEWLCHPVELRRGLINVVVGYMSFDTSPRYLAEVHQERAAFEADLHRSRAAQPKENTDTNIVQLKWGEDPEPEMTKPVRVKPKPTRDAKVNGLDLAKLDINEQPNPDVQKRKVTIAVKKGSKRFFDKIFSRNATASKFRWSHLVNALVDTGMVATQSAGCAVRFENDQGSIVLHCPHGDAHDSALSAEFLRNEIGKRLTKWFAWDVETFVERTKNE
jgi:hypothetical protein